MFEKEKVSGNNFNDWFARLKLVLRVKKKMHVIEQPLPPAPKAGVEPNIVAQWTGFPLKARKIRENQLAHMSLDEIMWKLMVLVMWLPQELSFGLI
ncbi:hypothetical protein Tco_0830353 [Tanacetum coccineum]